MKKNGFTLIELLAVIVILAIIALIAVPIVLGIINDAKIESQKRSVDMYAKSIEQAIARYNVNNIKKISGGFTTEDGKLLKQNDISFNVDYNGDVVCNTVVIYDSGKVYLSNCKVDGVDIDYKYAEHIKNMLIDDSNKVFPSTGQERLNYTFLNTGVKSSKIKQMNIVTTGTTVNDGYDSIDCSYNQDKSVICYWKEDNEGYYEMNISAKGDIYTPYYSAYLFAMLGYYKMEALDLTGINTKYSINMQSMFSKTGYTLMTNLNLGNKFDTTNVINMEYMFSQTGLLEMTSLDLHDKFNTENVISMCGMFNNTGKEKMTSLNLGDNFDTFKVKNMIEMFAGLGINKMETLNLGNKFDTTNVTNMMSMFSSTGKEKMTSLNIGDKFNTSNVTNMKNMFYDTGRMEMTSLNLGDKFDTSKAKTMEEMFHGTGKEKMTSLNLGRKFVIKEGIPTTNIFYNCGTNGILTNVIVYNQELKNKIESLSPSWWGTNNIVTVEN